MRPPSLSALFGFTVGLAVACVEEQPNPEHCSSQQGNVACSERFPDGDRPYCAMLSCTNEPWGCVAEPPSDESCYSPCGEGASASENSSCLGTADEETGTTSDTEGGSECAADEDCGSQVPFCVEGICVGCEDAPDPDAACAGMSNGALPVCEAGVCVQCTSEASEACIELMPVCDIATSTCTGCDFHSQCPGSACRVLDGSCLPDDRVWHVDADGGQDFLSIGQALLQINTGESGTLIVHEQSGGAAYQEALAIADGRVVALLAAPGERPFLANDVGTTLRVEAEAEVFTRGILVAGIEPIRVEGATLVLDETEVQGSVSAGVQLSADARLIARNTILLSSGSDNFFGPALTADMSRFELVYSTVIGRLSNLAVLCTMGTAGSFLRNSLIGSEGAEAAIDCAEITLLNNALEDAAMYPGNVTVGELQPQWFVGGTNYRLSAEAPTEIATAAIRQEGDPLADIDGELRPEVGEPDYAGADRIGR
ncbi:hypothetical protein ACNOYE_07895 [Nannocystaceae bacterium ST9]